MSTKPMRIMAAFDQRIAAAKSAGKPMEARTLADKKVRYNKKVCASYLEACALMLEAQAEYLREGSVDQFNEVAAMCNETLAEYEAFNKTASAEETGGGVVRLAEIDDEVIAKHAQVLGATVVVSRELAAEGDNSLSPIIADAVDELVELEAKAKTSRSSTMRAYRKMKRKKPHRKKWLCYEQIERHRSKRGRTLWSTLCWYQSLKTRRIVPTFRVLGDVKKHPQKPKVVIMGKKKLRKCTQSDEKKFALMNAKIARMKAKKGRAGAPAAKKPATKPQVEKNPPKAAKAPKKVVKAPVKKAPAKKAPAKKK